MRIQVNPNRMELFKLRKRRAIALRAHKLLKDKLEGLIKEFLKRVKEYKEARLKLDLELPIILRLFVLSTLASHRQAILTALEQSAGRLTLQRRQRRIMNLPVPVFSVSIIPGTAYSFLDTPPELDEAVSALKEYFPQILRLAELEQSVRLLAKEIEKTRRRVNALEHTLIPSLIETIRFIKNKLDELARLDTVRLMKVKKILTRR